MGIRILVIDDEPTILRVVRRILRQLAAMASSCAA